MLPTSYAKWQLVYYYYKKWGDNEHFDLLLAKLRECVRIKKSQNKEASLGIIASKRIRWGNNRFLNGYDGNKKIKRITSHVVVDQNGFLLAMMVTVANIHDSKAALLLMRVLKSLLCNIKVIIADGEIIKQVKNKFGYTIQVIVRFGKKCSF